MTIAQLHQELFKHGNISISIQADNQTQQPHMSNAIRVPPYNPRSRFSMSRIAATLTAPWKLTVIGRE
jgi:hypothetical protein